MGRPAFVPVEATPLLSSGPVISEESVEGAGVYAPSFGEARCSARPLPITQRADDIPAEAQ